MVYAFDTPKMSPKTALFVLPKSLVILYNFVRVNDNIVNHSRASLERKSIIVAAVKFVKI